MYDSDIGFGLGGKGLLKNHLKRDESFDLILFGSTKGEQWYVFTFSIPDFEIRQGTVYALAVDLKIEYDKILKSNFFGFGNDTEDNDWQFPKEMAKLDITLGRAFTEQIIAEVGLSFEHVSVYDFEDINPFLNPSIPGTGEHFIAYATIKGRWDTRDSQIHPRRGWTLGVNSDFASEALGSDHTFQRYRLEINRYFPVFVSGYILAVRGWVQHVEGTPPYYEQSAIGGGWTARGFKADRFLDRAMLLTSVEYRFPIRWRIGGVLFADAGRVYSGLQKASLRDWKANWGAGLRYYLQNFVVRFDVGISNEGERIFINFGHVF